MSADMYEKCADCHLFVDPNPAAKDSTDEFPVAPFLHLHRGDAADEAIDDGHEARPSGLVASLMVWRAYGPLPMRLRFVDDFPLEDS